MVVLNYIKYKQLVSQFFSRSPAVIRFSPLIAGTTKASSGPRLLNGLLCVAFMGEKINSDSPTRRITKSKKGSIPRPSVPHFFAQKKLVNTHVFIFPRFPFFKICWSSCEWFNRFDDSANQFHSVGIITENVEPRHIFCTKKALYSLLNENIVPGCVFPDLIAKSIFDSQNSLVFIF